MFRKCSLPSQKEQLLAFQEKKAVSFVVVFFEKLFSYTLSYLNPTV